MFGDSYEEDLRVCMHACDYFSCCYWKRRVLDELSEDSKVEYVILIGHARNSRMRERCAHETRNKLFAHVISMIPYFLRAS